MPRKAKDLPEQYVGTADVQSLNLSSESSGGGIKRELWLCWVIVEQASLVRVVTRRLNKTWTESADVRHPEHHCPVLWAQKQSKEADALRAKHGDPDAYAVVYREYGAKAVSSALRKIWGRWNSRTGHLFSWNGSDGLNVKALVREEEIPPQYVAYLPHSAFGGVSVYAAKGRRYRPLVPQRPLPDGFRAETVDEAITREKKEREDRLAAKAPQPNSKGTESCLPAPAKTEEEKARDRKWAREFDEWAKQNGYVVEPPE